MIDVLQQLSQTLEARKGAAADESYVASLYAGGLDKILEKVGEESVETIIAAKNADRDPGRKDELVYETADLWFHSLVMLAALELKPDDVIEELARRFDLSGHDEKAARKTSG